MHAIRLRNSKVNSLTKPVIEFKIPIRPNSIQFNTWIKREFSKNKIQTFLSERQIYCSDGNNNTQIGFQIT